MGAKDLSACTSPKTGQPWQAPWGREPPKGWRLEDEGSRRETGMKERAGLYEVMWTIPQGRMGDSLHQGL